MKVFSVEKWKERMRSIGDTDEEIKEHYRMWAKECDGLTEEEMKVKGLGVIDTWMIEKEEK